MCEKERAREGERAVSACGGKFITVLSFLAEVGYSYKRLDLLSWNNTNVSSHPFTLLQQTLLGFDVFRCLILTNMPTRTHRSNQFIWFSESSIGPMLTPKTSQAPAPGLGPSCRGGEGREVELTTTNKNKSRQPDGISLSRATIKPCNTVFS